VLIASEQASEQALDVARPAPKRRDAAAVPGPGWHWRVPPRSTAGASDDAQRLLGDPTLDAAPPSLPDPNLP